MLRAASSKPSARTFMRSLICSPEASKRARDTRLPEASRIDTSCILREEASMWRSVEATPEEVRDSIMGGEEGGRGPGGGASGR